MCFVNTSAISFHERGTSLISCLSILTLFAPCIVPTKNMLTSPCNIGGREETLFGALLHYTGRHAHALSLSLARGEEGRKERKRRGRTVGTLPTCHATYHLPPLLPCALTLPFACLYDWNLENCAYTTCHWVPARDLSHQCVESAACLCCCPLCSTQTYLHIHYDLPLLLPTPFIPPVIYEPLVITCLMPFCHPACHPILFVGWRLCIARLPAGFLVSPSNMYVELFWLPHLAAVPIAFSQPLPSPPSYRCLCLCLALDSASPTYPTCGLHVGPACHLPFLWTLACLPLAYTMVLLPSQLWLVLRTMF